MLADFGRTTGRDLRLDADGACTFVLDGDVPVTLQYLPAGDMVLAWSMVGSLPEDESAGERAMFLMRVNGDWEHSGGFTFGMDEEDRTVVASDVHSTEWLHSDDRLAYWIDRLVRAVKYVRETCGEEFPYYGETDDETEEGN